MSQVTKQYDLQRRTTDFSKNVLIFCKKLQFSYISKTIIEQVVRSATSIGANYAEANGASSKRDFRNKICICKKEAEETKYWLQLLGVYYENNAKEIKSLLQESHELLLIFQKILLTLKEKIKKQDPIKN
jgi:four helix bundle protein